MSAAPFVPGVAGAGKGAGVSPESEAVAARAAGVCFVVGVVVRRGGCAIAVGQLRGIGLGVGRAALEVAEFVVVVAAAAAVVDRRLSRAGDEL